MKVPLADIFPVWKVQLRAFSDRVILTGTSMLCLALISGIYWLKGNSIWMSGPKCEVVSWTSYKEMSPILKSVMVSVMVSPGCREQIS